MQSPQPCAGEQTRKARMIQERTAMKENTMENNLMHKALMPEPWEAALSAVERNGGAPGPDGMRTGALRTHLAMHGEVIRRRLLEGSYQPAAARRKEIAKPSGGTRSLSIPNVQDRFVQQLLRAALQPEFEPRFSESSHGFRPRRSAHDAVKAAQGYAREGYTHVVDMDITKFFDRVNHDILMHKIGQVIRDKSVLRLIGKFLRAGVVMPDGLAVSAEEGTPQGGPLSPLLANIYLDALDKELEKRGLRFARYADDCNIYVGSAAAAQRVLASLTGWLARHLRLEVNSSKSGTGRPWERKFLGFIITANLLIGIAPASLAKFKDQVREKWNARQSLTEKRTSRPVAQLRGRMVGILSARGRTPTHLSKRKMDPAPRPQMVLAAVAQERGTSGSPQKAGHECPLCGIWTQQRGRMGDGPKPGAAQRTEQPENQQRRNHHAI